MKMDSSKDYAKHKFDYKQSLTWNFQADMNYFIRIAIKICQTVKAVSK